MKEPEAKITNTNQRHVLICGGRTQLNYDDFEITGNRNGLISLAAFFMSLAQEGVPDGTSILLTDKNGLSKGSLDLMIIKKE